MSADRERLLAELDEAYRNLERVILDELAEMYEQQRKADRRANLRALLAELICCTPIVAFVTFLVIR